MRSKPSRSSPKNLHFTTMTAVRQDHSPLPFVLPKEHPNNILANVMAQLNWKNLRVAETEKYAHVTYFFNGGNEKPYRRRRARAGAVAEGRDLRSEARDERGRRHRRRWSRPSNGATST